MNENIHPTTVDVNRRQIEQSNKSRVDTLKWLAETFPEAFDTEVRVRPLKKGIMQDIFDYLEDKPDNSISNSKLRETVVMFARRMEYLVCLKCRNDRVDLNGKFAGEVTLEESELAAQKIKQHLHNSIERNTSEDAKFDKSYSKAKPKPYFKDKSLDNISARPTYRNDDSSMMSAAQSSASTTASTQTQVTIKRKISKRIDPEAVARFKAKLDIDKKKDSS